MTPTTATRIFLSDFVISLSLTFLSLNMQLGLWHNGSYSNEESEFDKFNSPVDD